MRRETARERALRRWFLFPVDVPLDAPLGEDVTRTPLSRWEFEYLAGHGPMLPGATIPPEGEESRIKALTEGEYQAILRREQGGGRRR
jgi:hypothetical protein